MCMAEICEYIDFLSPLFFLKGSEAEDKIFLNVFYVARARQRIREREHVTIYISPINGIF